MAEHIELNLQFNDQNGEITYEESKRFKVKDTDENREKLKKCISAKIEDSQNKNFDVIIH
jgi:hypothetical protein